MSNSLMNDKFKEFKAREILECGPDSWPADVLGSGIATVIWNAAWHASTNARTAEPVAYGNEKEIADTQGIDCLTANKYKTKFCVVPLYIHPPASQPQAEPADMSEAKRLIVQLRGRVEELQAEGQLTDAERYRWLRDIGDSTWQPMAMRLPEGAKGIDAAIDAAIKELQK